jgi:ABC-type glycerol-3-phosphate transport system substrate-binding protein
MRKGLPLLVCMVVAGLLLSAATGFAGGTKEQSSAAQKPVSLTFWHNYGTEINATTTEALVQAYASVNPNVKINLVSQPADNYFALLQSAAVSKTGPDLIVMWTGLFALKYKDYLTQLDKFIPLSDLKELKGIEWSSDGFDPANGVLVAPLEDQFYIGFYNKALFKKAGITQFPRDWNEFFAACQKLKDAGITPLIYGNGGQNLGAAFYPWYDYSYMMIGAYPLDKWKGFYDGAIPYTSPTIVDQMNKWVSLHEKGYTNSDVITTTNVVDKFIHGQAAMIMDGTWDTKTYEEPMGDNVAAFVPPFSNDPIKGVVEYAGDGYSITTYSQHQKEAADFIKFMISADGQKTIDKAGLIPDRKGFTTSDPINQSMLDFANKQGFTRYPMIDNVIQGNVVNTGSQVLDAALAGQTTVTDALKKMQDTFMQLPADQRSSTYK